jgi:hypothetical protein
MVRKEKAPVMEALGRGRGARRRAGGGVNKKKAPCAALRPWLRHSLVETPHRDTAHHDNPLALTPPSRPEAPTHGI